MPSMPSSRSASKAPVFTSKTIDGKPFDLAEQLAQKNVVLFFWSFFCGPCKEEMPLIEQYSQEIKDQPVAFVGVNLDEPALHKPIKAYLKMEGYSYPIIVNKMGGEDFMLDKKYLVTGTPTMYMIRRDGTVSLRPLRPPLARRPEEGRHRQPADRQLTTLFRPTQLCDGPPALHAGGQRAPEANYSGKRPGHPASPARRGKPRTAEGFHGGGRAARVGRASVFAEGSRRPPARSCRRSSPRSSLTFAASRPSRSSPRRPPRSPAGSRPPPHRPPATPRARARGSRCRSPGPAAAGSAA